LEFHVTFLFTAAAGVTFAISVSLSPAFKVNAVLLSDTPVTAVVVVGESFVMLFKTEAAVVEAMGFKFKLLRVVVLNRVLGVGA
jgi:hypothetical protein